MLLIQGVGLVGDGWRPQIAGLADRFDLVWFDNRGIGASRSLTPTLTIEAMAADALAVVDAERIPRFHVVGHSMGGVIAQAVALAAPDRVRSLSLLCTFLRGRDGARVTPGMLVTGVRTRIGTRAMRRHAFLDLVMPAAYLRHVDRAHLAERLRPLFGHDLADQPPVVMRQLRAMARYDATGRLTELGRIPTLVVSAEHDRISPPRYGRALAAAIPNARYAEVPGAGHGVPIQCADEVNALLADHLLASDPGTG